MSERATVVFSGRALRARRRQQRLSTTELGAAVGRTAQTIWNYESGNSAPDGATALMLAGALLCDVVDLYEDDERG